MRGHNGSGTVFAGINPGSERENPGKPGCGRERPRSASGGFAVLETGFSLSMCLQIRYVIME
jgi:hypothetical protein